MKLAPNIIYLGFLKQFKHNDNIFPENYFD